MLFHESLLAAALFATPSAAGAAPPLGASLTRVAHFAFVGASSLGGLLGGIVAGRLADGLPKRAELTHLTEGPRRTRRNLTLAAVGTLSGIALGLTTTATSASLAASAFALAMHLALVAGLLASAAIDVEHMVLPNELTLGGAVLGLALSPFRPVGLYGALLGVVVALAISYVPSVLYKKLRGHEGAGLGDAKLTLLAGAWFGPAGAVFVLFAGAVQVSIAALVMRTFGLSFPIPESVKAEIAELRVRAANGDAEAIELLAGDPMAVDLPSSDGQTQKDPAGDSANVGGEATTSGLGTMRLPLGPFLVLACFEFLFFRDAILSFVDHFLEMN